MEGGGEEKQKEILSETVENWMTWESSRTKTGSVDDSRQSRIAAKRSNQSVIMCDYSAADSSVLLDLAAG